MTVQMGCGSSCCGKQPRKLILDKLDQDCPIKEGEPFENRFFIFGKIDLI